MRIRALSVLATGACLLAGCYHATITTGATPSSVTIDHKWASSWIYGLVPPATVETAQQCPAGVARVETRLSFLNQLVGLLTIGIYTPMDIRVTCAEEAPMESAILLQDADPATWAGALDEAALRSRVARRPVYIVAGE